MSIINEDRTFGKRGKEDTEIQAKQKKELLYQMSMLRRKGLKIWEFNALTGELSEIDLSPKGTEVTNQLMKSNWNLGTKLNSVRATIGKHCYYFEALNYKNAERKVKNFLSGKTKRLGMPRVGRRDIKKY